MSSTLASASDVIDFWFSELGPSAWWRKDPESDRRIDQLIEQRFGATHAAAARVELFVWRQSARGRLAEVLVLDQFSRHLYRDRPGAFAADPLALALAQEAVSRGVDAELSPSERHFLYMPYMHSESALVHVEAERLFRELGSQEAYDFELAHKVIIDRFGRYPHRNRILGRTSTPEELEFLKGPGSSF